MEYKEFRQSLHSCPFCSLSHNEIISENMSAFLTYALAPYIRHHLLVVPKRHIEKIGEATPEEEKDISDLQMEALNLLHKLGHENVTFLARDGENSGKSIHHIHYHVVPDIQLGDITHEGTVRKIMEKDEIDGLLKEIKQATEEGE